MQWLSNIMNWGSAASSAAPAASSGAGYGLGQPLVVGDIGSAQYAAPAAQGTDWQGLLGSAAKGYLGSRGQQQEQIGMQHNAPRFGGPRKNPGAKHLSGLLISNTNMSES